MKIRHILEASGTFDEPTDSSQAPDIEIAHTNHLFVRAARLQLRGQQLVRQSRYANSDKETKRILGLDIIYPVSDPVFKKHVDDLARAVTLSTRTVDDTDDVHPPMIDEDEWEHVLSGDGGYDIQWFKRFRKWIARLPLTAAICASKFLGRRWLAAEPYIKTDACAAVHYAVNVLGGRWPAAEDVIRTDADYAARYADQILGTEWPEAESVIFSAPTSWPGLRYVTQAVRRPHPTYTAKLSNGRSTHASTLYATWLDTDYPAFGERTKDGRIPRDRLDDCVTITPTTFTEEDI